MRYLLIAAMSAIISTTAYGMTGSELKANCKYLDTMKINSSSDAYKAGKCIGFLEGVAEVSIAVFSAAKEINAAEVVCIPENATFGQMVDLSLKYLNDKPERLHEPASDLVFSALQEAFPYDTKSR